MVLANSPVGPAWTGLWSTSVGPALTIGSLVNQGLMAVFFFVVGLQIKRECTVGTLANLKAALMPCLAAVGGMVVPVAMFAALNLGHGGLLNGWAIPMATDIALVMGIVGFFAHKMPPAASAFLLTMGTVTNVVSANPHALHRPLTLARVTHGRRAHALRVNVLVCRAPLV